MDRPVFIVADALVARYVAADPRHRSARTHWSQLSATRPPLITTPAMLDAAATILARTADPAFAAARLRRWLLAESLQILEPTADDRLAAADWLSRWRGGDADLADCTAWTVMTRLRLNDVFTWREAYRWAGFTLLVTCPKS